MGLRSPNVFVSWFTGIKATLWCKYWSIFSQSRLSFHEFPLLRRNRSSPAPTQPDKINNIYFALHCLHTVYMQLPVCTKDVLFASKSTLLCIIHCTRMHSAQVSRHSAQQQASELSASCQKRIWVWAWPTSPPSTQVELLGVPLS